MWPFKQSRVIKNVNSWLFTLKHEVRPESSENVNLY